MATTSRTLAGKAFGGRHSGGKGRVVAMIAAVGLGVSLVAGGILGQGRQAAQPAIAPVAQPVSNPYWVYTEDMVINGDPAAAARSLLHVNPYWTYQEDVVVNGDPAAEYRIP